MARGAAALVVERPLPGLDAPQLVVDAARPALASAAAWWYGDPSRDLTVIGITGTDGKTTTTYLAVAALEAAGRRTGMIGTIATRIGGRTDAHADHATTPEAPGAPGDPARDGRCRRRGRRRRDDLARPGPRSGRLGRLRRRDPDQRHPRAPRAARHVGGLSRRQALAVLRLEGPDGTAIVNLDDPSAGVFIGAAWERRARVITYGTEPPPTSAPCGSPRMAPASTSSSRPRAGMRGSTCA